MGENAQTARETHTYAPLPHKHTRTYRTTHTKKNKEETLRRLSREREGGGREGRGGQWGDTLFVGAVGTRSIANYGRNSNTKNERTKNDQKKFRTASEGGKNGKQEQHSSSKRGGGNHLTMLYLHSYPCCCLRARALADGTLNFPRGSRSRIA